MQEGTLQLSFPTLEMALRKGEKFVTTLACMKNIFWKGYSNKERLSSINAISSIVSRFGDIVDVKLFSDISLTITIEIEEAKINNLYDDLKEAVSMDAFEYIHSVSRKERTIYLNISFASATGNLEIEVPAVPG